MRVAGARRTKGMIDFAAAACCPRVLKVCAWPLDLVGVRSRPLPRWLGRLPLEWGLRYRRDVPVAVGPTNGALSMQKPIINAKTGRSPSGRAKLYSCPLLDLAWEASVPPHGGAEAGRRRY